MRLSTLIAAIVAVGSVASAPIPETVRHAGQSGGHVDFNTVLESRDWRTALGDAFSFKTKPISEAADYNKLTDIEKSSPQRELGWWQRKKRWMKEHPKTMTAVGVSALGGIVSSIAVPLVELDKKARECWKNNLRKQVQEQIDQAQHKSGDDKRSG